MVIITGANGQVEWVNDGFIRQSGYQLKDIIGKRPGSLLQGPKSDPTTAFMHAQLEAGKGFRVQLINYTKQTDSIGFNWRFSWFTTPSTS